MLVARDDTNALLYRNYHHVLVLLLRLRQICSHPCLIQEDGVAFVHPDEAKVKPQFATELTRARRLVSSEFVEKMKEKFKQDALNRMQAEKQVSTRNCEELDQSESEVLVCKCCCRRRRMSHLLRRHDGCGHHSLWSHLLS